MKYKEKKRERKIETILRVCYMFSIARTFSIAALNLKSRASNEEMLARGIEKILLHAIEDLFCDEMKVYFVL